MKLFGLGIFGGKEGSVPVRTMQVERAAEFVFEKPAVEEACAAYVEQLQYMQAGGGDVVDRAQLAERKATALLALAREGVELEPIPGKYDRTEDESFEALIALYEAHKNPEQTEKEA